MNGAVVWYQSRAVLGSLVAILFAALTAFHIVLPATITQDQIVSALLVIIPSIIALEGRISATKQVVATPAKAAAVNAAPQILEPVPTPPLTPTTGE